MQELEGFVDDVKASTTFQVQTDFDEKVTILLASMDSKDSDLAAIKQSLKAHERHAKEVSCNHRPHESQ